MLSRVLFLACLCSLSLWAQQPSHSPSGTVTRSSEAAADIGYQIVPKLDSSTVNYYCYGPSRRPSSLTLTISTISEANPGAATVTSHGFNQYATILVRVSGATGAWAAINGLRVFTYVDANTLSIGVDTTSFGAYMGQTPTFTTFATRETDELWAIKKITLDGLGNLVWSGWASAAALTSQVSSNVNLVGGQPRYTLACASRATYGYQ